MNANLRGSTTFRADLFILFGLSCFAHVELATDLFVKSKAVKQEVSRTVMSPPVVSVLCLVDYQNLTVELMDGQSGFTFPFNKKLACFAQKFIYPSQMK